MTKHPVILYITSCSQ